MPLRAHVRILALALFLLEACAHNSPGPNSTTCPESQNMTCLGAPECSYDRNRGCRVCQCSSILGGTDHPHGADARLPGR